MRVTVTGATGLIGRRLVERLTARGDEVTVLSRRDRDDPRSVQWDPVSGAAPAEALSGRDAVVHLAGEPVAQRWTDEAKRRIRASREAGTRNLVEGLRAADPRPGVLVSSSAVGYYGPRGDEEVTETEPAGEDFLAGVTAVWESEAARAEELGLRVVRVRTGIVLDREGGALAKMLTPFKLGAGGPVAGGKQWMPWIHADDVAGIYVAALDGENWSGPVNATAPDPVRNRDFSQALGRALHRPAIAPIPGIALHLLYGEMAEIVTTGQRAIPTRPAELGYTFAHTDLDEALRSALRI
ncbi:MAG: uncharacterized protein QOJ97_1654 [Solirubrobacteraceae bacterium]|nr:uncharacterized protein [Solirubrobacteraceae bacterium]